MPENPFDELTEIYEAHIDWPKRLAREEPFYRRLFGQLRARRILDVACGTGRHAAMFHGWGLSVEASDLSPKMIERAKQQFGEDPSLQWIVRSFEDAVIPTKPFDAAICVGNSLALAADRSAAERGLAQMLAAVRYGGLAVVHVLNLGAIPEGPIRWQAAKAISWQNRTALVTKGIHRCGNQGYLDFVIATQATPEQTADQIVAPSIRFLGLTQEELERWAMAHGAAHVAVYGGLQEEAFEPDRSVDLVLTATKA